MYVCMRDTNPLLRASLITETVAKKMVTQMTCEEYLKLTDKAVTEMLKTLGVGPLSIKACLSKRADYTISADDP